MKRLLAISWEMPPMYGPRGAQVTRSLAALADLGWRSTVVCLAPRRGGPHWPDGVDAPTPRGVELERVPSPEEWLVSRTAFRVLPWLRDRPDSKWAWIDRAARAARRCLARERFDTIITFAQPWSDHLVGLRLHAETGLPWVAHFSDPWTDSPYISSVSPRRALWQRLEADVVRAAGALVFITEETADLVMAKYPREWRHKASIVPHGFTPHGASGAGQREQSTGRRTEDTGVRADDRPRPLTVVHTGRFYEGVRTPEALLCAIATLHARSPLDEALAVRFVGPHAQPYVDRARALDLGRIVTFRDRVPAGEAAAEAANADVLLAIDAPSEGPSVFLSSKVVEYLAFRKPILALTPPVGATASLMRRLGAATAPPDNVDEIAMALTALIDRQRAGALVLGACFDAVAAEYDIGQTTRRLDAVLARTIGRRAS